MAKQIKNFNKTKLPIGTQANFHKKVLTLIGTTTATALHVEGLEPQYEAAVETLSSIVNRPTTYVATQSRQETDNRRDRFVTVIHQVINAHKNNPLDEKRAAAATLAALMAPYRSITKHQYAKETEEINGMLAVLEAHATEAGLLGLTDEVAGLTEANAAFEAALDEKIAEEQARQAVSDIDSREATRAANDLYDQIVLTVNAYAIVSPTDEIGQRLRHRQPDRRDRGLHRPAERHGGGLRRDDRLHPLQPHHARRARGARWWRRHRRAHRPDGAHRPGWRRRRRYARRGLGPRRGPLPGKRGRDALQDRDPQLAPRRETALIRGHRADEPLAFLDRHPRLGLAPMPDRGHSLFLLFRFHKPSIFRLS